VYILTMCELSYVSQTVFVFVLYLPSLVNKDFHK